MSENKFNYFAVTTTVLVKAKNKQEAEKVAAGRRNAAGEVLFRATDIERISSAQAKLEAAKELNRHLEAMSEQIVKRQELEVKDRETARIREAEIVKATGHFDWMMWGLAAAGIAMLFYALYQLVNSHIENKELFTHFVGIIEGVVVSIYSYYFGSSLGSRIKDMK